jgi:hypothetical protein
MTERKLQPEYSHIPHLIDVIQETVGPVNLVYHGHQTRHELNSNSSPQGYYYAQLHFKDDFVGQGEAIRAIGRFTDRLKAEGYQVGPTVPAGMPHEEPGDQLFARPPGTNENSFVFFVSKHRLVSNVSAYFGKFPRKKPSSPQMHKIVLVLSQRMPEKRAGAIAAIRLNHELEQRFKPARI